MKIMAKTAIIFAFGLLSLIFIISCLAAVDANTVVGGKVYNSDFSEIIEGADVTVTCGSDIKTTESIGDGTYAIAFDSESCYLDSEVDVSAYKGDLSDSESGVVYESEEEEGEWVSVINLNLKSSDSGSSSRSRDRGSTWFMCGNTVCDSGEDYQTCPIDCPQTVDQTEEETTTNTDSASTEESEQETSSESETGETTNPGITGAVVGAGENSGKNRNFFFSFIGIILLLVIGVAGVGIAKNENKYRPPKMEDRSLYKPLSAFY